MSKGLLIGFIGSPYSGKTTTAALLFGELKKIGVQAEYLPEYARDRIRQLKANGTMRGFDENHQIFIRDQQAKFEALHVEYNGPGTITVTDGSTANSFFYEGSNDLGAEIARYDLLFFSRNIEVRSAKDANRVHDETFSKNMEEKILKELNLICPVVKNNLVILEGDIDQRLATALKATAFLVQSGERKLEASNN